MVEDQNGAAVFLAQFQLAVGDTKESVALIEYRAARVSERRRARLSLTEIDEPEFRFEIFHLSRVILSVAKNPGRHRINVRCLCYRRHAMMLSVQSSAASCIAPGLRCAQNDTKHMQC